MSLFINNLIDFIKEKTLVIKTLFSLSLLISLFTGAIILNNIDYSQKLSDIDKESNFEIISISNKSSKNNTDICDTSN